MTVDAHGNSPPPAVKPDSWLGRWPPVCAVCGHRHAGEPCADHTWRDDCSYDAAADCPGPTVRYLENPLTFQMIICPECLAHSSRPEDAANQYCGQCHKTTGGKVVDLPTGSIEEAQRAQALYAVELFAGRARAYGADPTAIHKASREGFHDNRMGLHTLHTDQILATLRGINRRGIDGNSSEQPRPEPHHRD